MKTRQAESVNCCVTSPPYFGLRDYGVAGQLGLEKSPQAFVDAMVEVFTEVHRLLKPDGTLWLNLGDSYTSGNRRSRDYDKKNPARSMGFRHDTPDGLKPKDLIGIPWRVAFALQAQGWYLRSAIPWLKRNCMPESTTDRPTTAVEYVFLFSKSPRYFYDHESVKMPVATASVARLSQDTESQLGSERANGGAKTNGAMKAVCRGGKNAFRGEGHFRDAAGGPANRDGRDMKDVGASLARNRRNSDWFWESWQGLLHDEDGDPLAFLVNPQPYRGAHFATWPPKLVRPMILAGTQTGGVVLDPFGGSGTTGAVALELGRSAVLIELNQEYIKLAQQRCNVTAGLPLT